MLNSDLVVIKDLKLFAETDAAILVGPHYARDDIDRDKEWIPLSFVEFSDFSEIGDVSDIEIPRWVADQKGLEYEDNS